MSSGRAAFSCTRLGWDEVARVAMIHREAFDERLPWLAGLHTPAEDLAFFRDVVFVECELWGIVDDDELIGFIAFRDGWIDQLYVRPHRQGYGVGGALLAIAKAANPAGLRLWTFARNEHARRFYMKHGFIAIDETDGSGNDEREPDILYRWETTEADRT